jgi:protoporphyrin/coproporphyrin ferrochelatase
MMNLSENSLRWGVILLAHGAPDRLEDIPAYLLRVRNGRPLPPAAVEEIVSRYRLVSSLPGVPPGEASPLTRLTFRQAQALRERLGRPVYVGMRNWKPHIAEAVKQAAADGIGHLVGVCLAPQNSRTSVGQYRKALEEARQEAAPSLSIDFVSSWHDHPRLVAAFRGRLAVALARVEPDAGAPVAVVFTGHSVPERTIREGDPYEKQVRETARLVAESLGLEGARWSVAFQSQGMTPEPWIGPTVESEIDRCASAGYRHVVVAPVGFVCDHVEILYDIDIGFRQFAINLDMELRRPESLNGSPLLIAALADLSRNALARLTQPHETR